MRTNSTITIDERDLETAAEIIANEGWPSRARAPEWLARILRASANVIEAEVGRLRADVERLTAERDQSYVLAGQAISERDVSRSEIRGAIAERDEARAQRDEAAAKERKRCLAIVRDAATGDMGGLRQAIHDEIVRGER